MFVDRKMPLSEVAAKRFLAVTANAVAVEPISLEGTSIQLPSPFFVMNIPPLVPATREVPLTVSA